MRYAMTCSIGLKKPVIRAALLVTTAFSTALVSAPAMAQRESATRVPASSNARPAVRFNIAAQQLGDALIAFTQQAGVQLVVNPADVQAYKSVRLTGSYPPSEAARLLIGASPLSVEWVGANTMVVKPRAASVRPVALQAAPAPAPVAAPQVASVPEATVDPDIVVTAQGRTESLQSVPLSVSVTSGESLEKGAIADLGDLSSHISGVKITAAPGASLLNIRGIGSGLNPGFEQSVGTFVDGVYRGRSRAIGAALFDIDRVEVLKGPQTTFFGNNTIAGAFNITTRKPGHEFSYNASALFGTYGQYALEGAVTVPLTDTLSVRVAGKAYGQDGYVKNAVTDDYGPHQRDWIGRVSVLWEPTDTFTTRLRFDRTRLRDRDSFPSELIGCPPAGGTPAGLCNRYLTQNGGPVDDKLDLNRAGYPGVNNYDSSELAWINELHLGDFTLSATTSYFEHKVEFGSDPWPVPVTGAGGQNAVIPIIMTERYRNFSQEVRLASPADRTVSYILGAYFSEGKLNTRAYTGLFFLPFAAFLPPEVGLAPTDRLAISGSLNQKDTVKSVFGSVTINFSESLRLNGGLRYSVVKKRASRSYLNATANNAPWPGPDNFDLVTPEQQDFLNIFFDSNNENFPNPKRTDKKLMPSVSLQYDVTPEIMAYASFANGFKAGGFSDGQVVNTFGPENVSAYEIGLKSTLFDRRMTLNIAAFWNDFKDLQETANILSPTGNNLEFVGNAGQARSRGIEVGTTFRINDSLRFQAEVGYLEAKYTSFPAGPCTTAQTLATPAGELCRQDLGGKARPFAPKWSGSAGFSYSLPIGKGVVSFDPSVRFSSSYFQLVNNDPLLVQPGYAKIDARLAYGAEDKSWEIAVIGTNLTDKLTGTFRNSVGTSPGTTFVLPEEGRAVAVQLSIRH